MHIVHNRVKKYENDAIMRELLLCAGNPNAILTKLNELNLYGCDFTLEEIGDILDITRERVRQIENSAIKKIKNPKNARMIRKYFKI